MLKSPVFFSSKSTSALLVVTARSSRLVTSEDNKLMWLVAPPEIAYISA